MVELTDGATAICRGALDAGCSFFAGYPITPASQILMTMMRELPKVGGVAIQGEDEIASIGMCIGAAMAGARALTATSGPGLSLYSESIGLAIMGEVPLVIVDVQRLGPATGGATTVAQGDVQFARWGTAGGYPLIVLAPSSIPECYTLTARAFALADRFRCPVLLLTDKELNLTANTVELAPEGIAPPPVRPRVPHPAGDRPYAYEPPEAVPPLRIYCDDGTLRFTGSTHDERAFITKHPPTVDALNRHLAAKIDEHLDELELAEPDLQEGARVLVLSYGVTAGAMREAVARLRRTGRRVSAITLHALWPVPERLIRNAMAGVERVVVAELNLGQYRREIERLAEGRSPVAGVHRVDGELISPAQIEEALQ
ncbi:MAG TPA: pyruvate flavodoxin/ferredoxin oxidoreductase [Thermoanaerobaculia bacterium]|nr:pyruvate flavodoxin/ferredoxin oxidoreductase [Thermoanaerobaculia bacterium]